MGAGGQANNTKTGGCGLPAKIGEKPFTHRFRYRFNEGQRGKTSKRRRDTEIREGTTRRSERGRHGDQKEDPRLPRWVRRG